MGVGAEWHGMMFGMPFLWMVLVFVPFAIGNHFLAGRLNREPWLWAVLTLVPLVNYFFLLYVGYTVVYAVLDRLAALQPGAGAARSAAD